MSPDGTTLAMRAWAQEGSDNGRLITVRTDGTDFREVFGPFPGGGWSDLLRWTPDGQSLLFSARVVDASGVRTWEILRVPAQGGAAAREGLNSANLNSAVKLPDMEKNNISSLDVSPDGSRLVFSSSARPTYEVWALDNVASILKP
jgi:Tol biopolymer transport system component